MSRLSMERGYTPELEHEHFSVDATPESREEKEITPDYFIERVETILTEAEETANRTIEDIEQKEAPLVAAETGSKSSESITPLTELREKIQRLQQKFLRDAKRYVPIILLALSESHQAVPRHEGFQFRDQARQELKETGITTEQKRAYKPGISELLYRGITPLGYQSYVDTEKPLGKMLVKLDGEIPNLGAVQRFLPNVILGRERDVGDKLAKMTKPSEIPGLEDAWHLYLGLPEEHNTFGISDYRPANSHEDKYYYKINDFWSKFQKFLMEERGYYHSEEFKEFVSQLHKDAKDEEDFNKSVDGWALNEKEERVAEYLKKGTLPPVDLKGYISELASNPGSKKVVESEVKSGETEDDIMYHYTMSLGQDDKGHYISYYDVWNLEGSLEGEKGIIGRPLEIYDRLYFDPETGELINPAPIQESAKK